MKKSIDSMTIEVMNFDIEIFFEKIGQFEPK